MKVQEYKVVEAPAKDQLEQKVNDFLSSGWQLYGSLVIKDIRFYQALVREIEQPGAWG